MFWDGTGLCLFAKRLEEGKFRWPRIEDGVMRLSAAQLAALVEGLDWKRVHVRRVRAPASRAIACGELNQPQDSVSQIADCVFCLAHGFAF